MITHPVILKCQWLTILYFRYTCGDGRTFYGSGLMPKVGTPQYQEYISDPENLKVRYYDMQNFTCMWDKTWNPTPDKFDECVCKLKLVTFCVNCCLNVKFVVTMCTKPPTAPPESHLKENWDGKPVNFGDKVRYQCLPLKELDPFGNLKQYKPRFFSSDKTKDFIDVQCLNGGLFNEPRPWPECVDGQ